MSKTRRFWTYALGTLAVLALLLQLTGYGYLWRALRHTYLSGYKTAHIDDARNFDQVAIEGPAQPDPWPRAQRQATVSDDTQAYLQQYRSAAFLVAYRGELIHEQYFAPYQAESRTNVFSMAKTLTTLLVGAAVADGIVPSFDAPIGLQEWTQDARGRGATWAQFAAMTSGHDWEENYYKPWNPTTELYFGRDVADTVLRQGFERMPGEAFEYSSASTQVLGVALTRALQARDPQQTLAHYLSERLWKPLGMSAGASWSLDRPRGQGGLELAYCCVHTTARDMARVGQLLLQKGQWRGQAVLPAAFIERITAPGPRVSYYGYGLWMDPDYSSPFYYLQGHLGQYVIVVPKHQLVIVRLGRDRSQARSRHPKVNDEVYRFVDEGLRMAGAR